MKCGARLLNPDAADLVHVDGEGDFAAATLKRIAKRAAIDCIKCENSYDYDKEEDNDDDKDESVSD